MADVSTILPLGATAPDFALPEVTDGTTVSLADVADADALVVMFLCRHCPYVQHVQDEVARIADEYAPRGVSFVGIAPNDPDTYPDDAPDSLAEQKRQVGWGFPYLFDATQEVAKAYGAACTPDTFVFDRDLRLVYRGQLDETRPRQGQQPTGRDLRAALDAVLAGDPVPEEQYPSVGCSIKWRPGNQPAA